MRYPPSQPDIEWLNDCSLRVSWRGVDDAVLRAIVPAGHERVLRSVKGIVDAAPAAASLLLTIDGLTTEPDAIVESVRRALAVEAAAAIMHARTIEIPVCYDGALAPDLEFVAKSAGLSMEGVASLHAGAEHTVRFIGFTPGFPYIDGLPEALRVPRLETPRTRVPAGSIAIAGSQTGIYPRATPGGWRIIGRTSRRLFDPGRSEPSLLRAGDRVRFIPISLGEFERAGARG